MLSEDGESKVREKRNSPCYNTCSIQNIEIKDVDEFIQASLIRTNNIGEQIKILLLHNFYL